MTKNTSKQSLGESRFISQVCTNTKSDLIEITEDKLENILIKFIRDFKKSIGWLTPLSIFLTLLVTNLTAEFKTFLGISKEIWCAIFYLALFLSFCWTIYQSFLAVRNIKKTRIQYLINKIKNN